MFMDNPDPWGAATNYLSELRIQSLQAANQMTGGGMGGSTGGSGTGGGGLSLLEKILTSAQFQNRSGAFVPQ